MRWIRFCRKIVCRFDRCIMQAWGIKVIFYLKRLCPVITKKMNIEHRTSNIER